MNIRVNLPDGSVVNFPQGTPQDEMQAEIEKFLASRQSPQRQPQTMAQARPPMSASDALPAQREVGQQPPVESLIREANPVRRRPAMSIEEAQRVTERQEAENLRTSEEAAKDPATMTDAELRAAEIAARNPIGNAGRAIADTFRGATRATASATQNKLGEAAAAIGMPSVGAALMQGADDIDASLESRRALEAEERAAADSEAQRLADERARRQGQAATPSASAAQDQQQPGPEQIAGQLPSARSPNAGQRTDVSMPREFSATAARPNAAPTFNMADGSVVKVGKAPPAAVKNAVRSGVDYMEQNMDQVIFGLLRQGKVQQAREFQTFMAERKTIRGMEETNRSYVALHYRDEGLWTKSLAGMVDNLYPDGEFEIDTKGTRFMRDDDGEVVGGIVSIRNKETGEVFEQEYIGMESLMRGVAEVGMPDAAYEYQKTRVEEARTKKIENAKSFTSAYDAAVELLFPDGFVDPQSMRPFTPEQRQEADRAIREYIASSRPDLPQPAPRPGAASGVGAVTGGSNGQPVPTWGN